MCVVAPSGECFRGKSPLDLILVIPWRSLFLAAFGLNLVVVAVLRDSRVIGCCLAWLRRLCSGCPAWQIVVKVERSVLTTINEDVMLCYGWLQVCLAPVRFWLDWVTWTVHRQHWPLCYSYWLLPWAVLSRAATTSIIWTSRHSTLALLWASATASLHWQASRLPTSYSQSLNRSVITRRLTTLWSSGARAPPQLLTILFLVYLE